jgi:hypothetical protein
MLNTPHNSLDCLAPPAASFWAAFNKQRRKIMKDKNSERVPIMDCVIDLALAQTTMFQIKQWFYTARNDAKSHPMLQGENGWPAFLAYYEWIEEKGRAVQGAVRTKPPKSRP